MRNVLVFSCHLLWAIGAVASQKLLQGGTIIAFDRNAQDLRAIRNGSILITKNRVTEVFDSVPDDQTFSPDIEVIDISGKLVSPGFIDTHRHGWQTAFKTLGSNISLGEYFSRYGEFAAGEFFTAEDVYVGQLAGLYEAMNAGVTTSLDHAHSTWSNETAAAGLQASIDSSARVFWAFAVRNVTGYNTTEQIAYFQQLAEDGSYESSRTSLGLAYDYWGSGSNTREIEAIMALARYGLALCFTSECNVSVITTHYLGGPYDINNSPETLDSFGALNTSIPVVISHASFITPQGAKLLRSTNQYISITPESEMHLGQTHPNTIHVQDQASLRVGCHFVFSTDILTQARIWMQRVRYVLYEQVLDRWEVPVNNPMSVNQAFLLATRHGALALRQDDLGTIALGAKADLVIWDGTSPALLGWADPVAAIMLHANVGDIDSVLIDGEFVKKDGRLVIRGYEGIRERFLASARRIQEVWHNIPLPVPEGQFMSGYPTGKASTVDTLRGEGNGYGQTHV